MAHNSPAAMRRAARWTCVEGMPHRCMLGAAFLDLRSTSAWRRPEEHGQTHNPSPRLRAVAYKE